jgi:hypothetical protein
VDLLLLLQCEISLALNILALMTDKCRVRKNLAQVHTPKSFSNLPWAVQDGIQQSPIEKGKCPTEGCVAPWGSGTRSLARIVLTANRICFAVMTVMFVALGSAADYGNIGCWLLLVLTAICWSPSMHDGYQETGSVACCYGVLYHCVHCICKSLFRRFVHSIHLILAHVHLGSHPCIYATVFPRLVRYIPHVRKAQEEDVKGSKIIQAEYGKIESLERNHVSSISTAHSNIGYLLTLVVNLSVLLPLQGTHLETISLSA